MQIQIVGRVVVGFDNCQTLRAKKRVRLLGREDREQEEWVRVVGVQQQQLPKIQSIVAGTIWPNKRSIGCTFRQTDCHPH